MQEKLREKIAGIARNRTGIAGIGKPALSSSPLAFANTRTLEQSRPWLRSFPIPGDSVAIPRDPGDSPWFSTSQAIVNAGTRYNRT